MLCECRGTTDFRRYGSTVAATKPGSAETVMKPQRPPPKLFIRDQDFEALLGSSAHRDLADARKDRAAAWVCYDISRKDSAPEAAATARLQCRYAHFHRLGPEGCPWCNTKQELFPQTGRYRPPQVEFVVADRQAAQPAEQSELHRVHEDWE